MAAARLVQRPVVGVRRIGARGPVVRTRRRGVTWELDLREGIDFSIWLRGYFEPATVAAYRRIVTPGATVVDVGANIGAHTLHLAHAVGERGRVCAFEPSQEAFRRLAVNLAANPGVSDRVIARQTMLLAAPGCPLPDSVVASWPLLPTRQLDATIPGRPQTTAGADASTLDAALDALDVGSVDLVKLDVDGYECDVLDGATTTLEQRRPAVLVEMAPFVLDVAGRHIDELLDRFAAHRYRLLSLRGDREVTRSEVAELSHQRASMNVLAVPR